MTARLFDRLADVLMMGLVIRVASYSVVFRHFGDQDSLPIVFSWYGLALLYLVCGWLDSHASMASSKAQATVRATKLFAAACAFSLALSPAIGASPMRESDWMLMGLAFIGSSSASWLVSRR